jgi:hypothetical protein
MAPTLEHSPGRIAAATRAPTTAGHVLMLVLALGACGRSPVHEYPDSPSVDAEVYAHGFCSFKCYRLDQCDLTGGIPKQTCEQTCIDEALETLPDDPCWAEQIELRRCIVREAACDGVEDEELPSGSEAECEHRAEQLEACGS